MDKEEIKYWELFIRRQGNDISDTELTALNSWKNDNPEAYGNMERIYSQSADADSKQFDTEADWHNLRAMMASERSGSPTSISIFPWVARVAAAVLMVLGITYIFYHRTQSGTEIRTMQTLVSADHTSVRQLVLPDSTVVWLNKGSEILFPEEFNDNTRTVYLKGEAFFDVAHNKDQPFIIHAGNSKTTVIGTSFNLRAYSGEDEIRLTVVSGKVAFTLSDDREQVIVTPGNIASLDNLNQRISSGVNADINFLSWKTGQLIFDNQPLTELLPSLERHYAARIRLGNEKLRACRFTGNFTDTSLSDVLSIITRSLGSTYKQQDGEFIIEGSGCE